MQHRKRLSVILKSGMSCYESEFSSVGGGYRPHIGLSTKMQNKQNKTFLAFLGQVFALEWTKK